MKKNKINTSIDYNSEDHNFNSTFFSILGDMQKRPENLARLESGAKLDKDVAKAKGRSDVEDNVNRAANRM